ncbi:MAG: hypothetical protein GX552_03620 [Chloroflexi bacterium]|jgi:hypothetical protein|nr:hypothetical protein [Chloroflexota bacterium]
MRKILPVAVAILCGIWTLLDFFVSEPLLDTVGMVLVEGVTILAAFALLLGILNILANHARRLVSGERHRALSLVLILALLGTLAVGVLLPNSTTFAWLFNYLYFPLQSTMAALLAFFVVSAVYRAFRLKNAQAFILLATSLIMFFIQLPFSAALIPGLSLVRDWLMAVPITAGVRGILLGAALGTIATSLRVLIGVDRPYAQAPAARAAAPRAGVRAHDSMS